ncbi:MAG: radical SAM protein [Candidatus Hadarchaeales archaeon]
MIPFSLREWVEGITAVVFLHGCNFRCPWCHNLSSLVLSPPPTPISVEACIEGLLREKDWIDGVVISGGEPTLQKDFCLALIEELRAQRLKVMMDTNGSNPETIRELIDKVDEVRLDLKAPLSDPKRYSEVTGTNDQEILDKVLHSLHLLSVSGKGRYRTTVLPGYQYKDVEEIAEYLSSIGIPLDFYSLNHFSFKGTQLASKEQMAGEVAGEEEVRAWEKTLRKRAIGTSTCQSNR